MVEVSSVRLNKNPIDDWIKYIFRMNEHIFRAKHSVAPHCTAIALHSIQPASLWIFKYTNLPTKIDALPVVTFENAWLNFYLLKKSYLSQEKKIEIIF